MTASGAAGGRTRIERIFADLRRSGGTALMPFIVGAHPSLQATEATVRELERTGAAVVEIGIPFSDPIADGPVIAEAMHEALQAGATPADVLSLVRRLRPAITMGLIAMVSQSIVERMGAREFFAAAAAAGFDGLIVPDGDLESAAALRRLADESGLAFSLLVAPSTPPERVRRIAALSSGFLYVLARSGITGESAELPRIAERLRALRALTDLPLAVGFGISSAEQVAAVTQHADAAIVGSALVRRMSEAARAAAPAGQSAARAAAAAAGALVGELRRGLRKATPAPAPR